MDFYLARNQPLRLANDFPQDQGLVGKQGTFKMYCLDGKTDYRSNRGVDREILKHFRKEGDRRIVVSVIVLNPENPKSSKVRLQLTEEGCFLRMLSTLHSSVKVKMDVSRIHKRRGISWVNVGYKTIQSEEMLVVEDQEATCQQDNFPLTEARVLQHLCIPNCEIYWTVTIHVTVGSGPPVPLPPRKIVLSPPVTVLEAMLKDEVHADVVIIADSGKPFKCHKSVLSTCSHVLARMFETDMKEAKTEQVEMPDMTERGVEAFLAYVYCSDVTLASGSSEVALELLRIAHKYNVISDMEAEISKLLIAQPADWFDLNVAVKLYQFARNLPSGEELKMKAAQVLKLKFNALPELLEYQVMFETDHEAAMELSLLFASL